MNATEKPELTDVEKAEKAEYDKKVKEHRRTLKDLRFLSTFFLAAIFVNALTFGFASVTVGCALGIFACFITAEYYRRRGPRK
jgi:hypothetical protein